MKKIISKILVCIMALSMAQGMSGTTASAKEESGVLVGGSEKVFLETGISYDVPVSFMKASDPTDASMATASLTGSTLIANADGTVTVKFHMTDITIMTAWGFAENLSLNNVHAAGGDTTAMSISSTYSKKLSYLFSSKTYTIPSEFTGIMPYLDQDGVYAQMNLKTGLQDMSQEGYFVFDFASVRADYSLVNQALAKVPADLSIYTAETVEVLNDTINQITEFYHVEKQGEVNAMAFAIEAAVAGLEEDLTDRRVAIVSGTVVASPSTFTIHIPESIQLGDLSTTEDTVIDYSIGVDMLPGNDGKSLEVTVLSKGNQSLEQGENEIPFVNSFTNYVFLGSEVIKETITVEPNAVDAVHYGDYQGTMAFEITSEYVD